MKLPPEKKRERNEIKIGAVVGPGNGWRAAARDEESGGARFFPILFFAHSTQYAHEAIVGLVADESYPELIPTILIENFLGLVAPGSDEQAWHDRVAAEAEHEASEEEREAARAVAQDVVRKLDSFALNWMVSAHDDNSCAPLVLKFEAWDHSVRSSMTEHGMIAPHAPHAPRPDLIEWSFTPLGFHVWDLAVEEKARRARLALDARPAPEEIELESTRHETLDEDRVPF